MAFKSGSFLGHGTEKKKINLLSLDRASLKSKLSEHAKDDTECKGAIFLLEVCFS